MEPDTPPLRSTRNTHPRRPATIARVRYTRERFVDFSSTMPARPCLPQADRRVAPVDQRAVGPCRTPSSCLAALERRSAPIRRRRARRIATGDPDTACGSFWISGPTGCRGPSSAAWWPWRRCRRGPIGRAMHRRVHRAVSGSEPTRRGECEHGKGCTRSARRLNAIAYRAGGYGGRGTWRTRRSRSCSCRAPTSIS